MPPEVDALTSLLASLAGGDQRLLTASGSAMVRLCGSAMVILSLIKSASRLCTASSPACCEAGCRWPGERLNGGGERGASSDASIGARRVFWAAFGKACAPTEALSERADGCGEQLSVPCARAVRAMRLAADRDAAAAWTFAADAAAAAVAHDAAADAADTTAARAPGVPCGDANERGEHCSGVADCPRVLRGVIPAAQSSQPRRGRWSGGEQATLARPEGAGLCRPSGSDDPHPCAPRSRATSSAAGAMRFSRSRAFRNFCAAATTARFALRACARDLSTSPSASWNVFTRITSCRQTRRQRAPWVLDRICGGRTLSARLADTKSCLPHADRGISSDALAAAGRDHAR